jgi:hypothetical protein
MVCVTFFLELLLLVLILKQSDAVTDQCSELKEKICQLEKDIGITTELKHNNEVLAGRCEVSGDYIVHYDTVICS